MMEVRENAGKRGLAARARSAWRWFFAAGNNTFPAEDSLRLGSSGPAASFCAKWGYLAVGAIFVHALVLALYGEVQQWLQYAILGAFVVALILSALKRLDYGKRFLEGMPIGLILLIALAIRIIWVVASDVTQTSDFQFYDRAAVLIARGYRWINPAWPTGAPVLYASIYAIFGHYPMLPQVLACFLSTLQIFFVFDITRRTMGSSLAGKIAALVMAFLPEHFIYTNLTGTEVPFATLVLGAVWLLGIKRGRYVSRVFLAGFLLGLANWVRPNAPLALAAVMLFVILKKVADEGWFTRVKISCATAVAFVAISLPFIWFNYYHLGIRSATISQKSGYNLMFGTNLEWGGQWNMDDEAALDKELSHRIIPKSSEPMIFKNRVAGEIGRWRLKNAPGEILDMALRRKISGLWATPACLIWSFDKSRFHPWYNFAHYTSTLYHVTMVVLASLAIFKQRSAFLMFDERWIFVALAVSATLVHLIFEVQPRYHNAYLPIFAICIGGFARSFENAAGKIIPFAQGEAIDRLFPKTRRAA
jgi:hypothetical protein